MMLQMMSFIPETHPRLFLFTFIRYLNVTTLVLVQVQDQDQASLVRPGYLQGRVSI